MLSHLRARGEQPPRGRRHSDPFYAQLEDRRRQVELIDRPIWILGTIESDLAEETGSRDR